MIYISLFVPYCKESNDSIVPGTLSKSSDGRHINRWNGPSANQ